MTLGGPFVATAVTAVLNFAHAPGLAVFIAGGFALAGLAWTIGVATEAVGTQFGPAATGFLQSTLANLPELFIVIFALRAGEVVVAQTTILGSIFANALLVLGLAIVAGAWVAPDGVMRFHRKLPNDTAVLLMLAVFIIVLLGLSHTVGDRASEHEVTISAIGAVLLLTVYIVWLLGYLRPQGKWEPAHVEQARPEIPLKPALFLLAGSAVSAAFVSEWFVHAIEPTVETLGISRPFIGIVIVAIAGNAVENVVGIMLAAKGKSDLAISVIKNSVAQIAVFLFPVLVLVSLLLPNQVTFVLEPVYIGALVLMALAIWQVTYDGEAAAYEGWSLVALFLILAVLVWFK